MSESFREEVDKEDGLWKSTMEKLNGGLKIGNLKNISYMEEGRQREGKQTKGGGTYIINIL